MFVKNETWKQASRVNYKSKGKSFKIHDSWKDR